jgi:hypothetical protein
MNRKHPKSLKRGNKRDAIFNTQTNKYVVDQEENYRKRLFVNSPPKSALKENKESGNLLIIGE